MTTDSNAETEAIVNTALPPQSPTFTRAKSRRIRKLPPREILGVDFVSPNSSKKINELLLSQNVSTQNRSILSELWGASPNQKTLLPPITIGSPQKKRHLGQVKSVATEQQVDDNHHKKFNDEDTFELNVIIPPALKKQTVDDKENKLEDFEDDAMSVDGEFDFNPDGLSSDNEISRENEDKEPQDSNENVGTDNQTSKEDNETPASATLQEDENVVEKITSKNDVTADDDTSSDSLLEEDFNDTGRVVDTLKESVVLIKTMNDADITHIDENNTIVEEINVTEESEPIVDVQETVNEQDQREQDTEMSTPRDITIDDTSPQNNQFTDNKASIIIPQDTKLYNEQPKSPMKDDIDEIFSAMNDDKDDSDTEESWLKLSDIEDENKDDDDALFNLISNAKPQQPKKRKRPSGKWIINGRPRPDPTRGLLRRQRLADKLEQPYIIRKKIKSTWIIS